MNLEQRAHYYAHNNFDTEAPLPRDNERLSNDQRLRNYLDHFKFDVDHYQLANVKRLALNSPPNQFTYYMTEYFCYSGHSSSLRDKHNPTVEDKRYLLLHTWFNDPDPRVHALVSELPVDPEHDSVSSWFLNLYCFIRANHYGVHPSKA